jgi:energy-coupling factor transport system ATP-binding protein
MIEVRDMTFRYAADLPEVLKGINLSIPEGSFTVFMGSNGSGKSTLARCLNGLTKPTAGSVMVDALDTHDPAAVRKIRRKVGLVFQDPNLQMTSVTIERELAFGLENIGTPTDEMRSQVDKYLQLFGFNERRNNPPSSLSAGEKQRLAIASVMILRPSYLVLDEATSLLSARSRTAVLDMVLMLRRQLRVAILLITQFPSEALLGDRLVLLHNGEIAFDGLPKDVFRHGSELIKMGVPVPLRERLRIAL